MSFNNLIFLDIDGVLCTHRAYEAVREKGMMTYLDPVAVGLVKRLVEDYKAQVVISSDWRLHHSFLDMVNIFKLSNACSIANALHTRWKTSELHSSRGLEIARWIDGEYAQKGEEYNYIIIDDNEDFMPHQLSRFIKCDTYDGLGFSGYMRAIDIFTRGDLYG